MLRGTQHPAHRQDVQSADANWPLLTWKSKNSTIPTLEHDGTVITKTDYTVLLVNLSFNINADRKQIKAFRSFHIYIQSEGEAPPSTC